MNLQTALTLTLSLFCQFSYASKPLDVNEMHLQENSLKIQNFEVRAFISDIKHIESQLSLFNPEFKGEYQFTDYIYYPRDTDFDLNKEFIRLRVYQQTHWDQKSVELSHKIKNTPGISGHLKFKKQFNSIEEAAPFLAAYRLAFSYDRKGYEYRLDDIKLFLEDIQGLPPSIELVSSSSEHIYQLFDEIAPVEILSDSVPKLFKNTLK